MSAVNTELAETAALMQAFGMTEDDLAANRAGTLTEHQRDRLGAALRGKTIGDIVILVLIILAAIYVVQHVTLSDKGSSQMLLAWIAFGVISFLVITGFKSAGFILDYQDGVVAAQHGRITLVKRGLPNREPSYFFQINGKEFQVVKYTYDLLRNNAEYEVYYAPRSREVLGILPTQGA
jgi:hypothetical protein